MDFAAWFQVYLGGKWHTFDARNNKPRIGRILMGTGRDAVDVALTTSFGQALLKQFVVVSDRSVQKSPTLVTSLIPMPFQSAQRPLREPNPPSPFPTREGGLNTCSPCATSLPFWFSMVSPCL